LLNYYTNTYKYIHNVIYKVPESKMTNFWEFEKSVRK
jgi:hypothetical protein